MAAVRLLLLLLLILSLSTLTFSIESEALLRLKKSFAPADLGSWVFNSDACADRWFGVICWNGVITSLSLQNMALSGTIDVEALSEISGLRSITFENNSFSGPIPYFSILGGLRALYLSGNKFSGEIRREYFSSMASLKKLWLDNNNFTGKIPDSVMTLTNLVELHLEGNQFSGPIPPLKQPTTVTSLDVSHNNLEGEIPESFSKFSADSFAENERLCGEPLNKLCTKVNPPPQPPLPPAPIQEEPKPSGDKNDKLVIASATIAFLMILIVISTLYARRNQRDDFWVLENQHLNDEVEVQETESNNNRGSRESSRKRHLSGKASNQGENSMGDLVMVSNERGSFTLSDLMKAAAEVLGNTVLGSTYKAAMANRLTVVVKRMKGMNVMERDTYDAEMRRLEGLRHPNILTPLAYHYRKEEKLVVSEYMPKGSLLFLLHGDRGVAHDKLNWPTRLKIIQGIANAMGFIHSEFASYELPHGNLKSSNVLLNENYEPLLSDYAFHPLIDPNHATQALFAYKTPEYIEYRQVSPKSDVYCLGIIILEILTGQFPSQYLSNGKGGTDVLEWVRSAISREREAELIDPDIASTNASSLAKMARLLRIGAACTESNPEQRPDMGEAIRKIEELQV